MKRHTNPMLLALLIAGFVFIGCAEVDSPTDPTDQNITPTSFPQLDSAGDDKENNRTNLTPADLIGSWKLTEIFPNKKEHEVYDLTFIFDEDGSGQISKEGEPLDIHWSLNKIVLEFTWDEKTWRMAAYLVDDDLYTVEWCEKNSDHGKNDGMHGDRDGMHGDRDGMHGDNDGMHGDKDGMYGEKDGERCDKNGEKGKKDVKKMRFVKDGLLED